MNSKPMTISDYLNNVDKYEKEASIRDINVRPLTRNNWEEAVKITLEDQQRQFVPSVMEGIAYAYLKPWDEALDPYVLELEGEIIGFFYLSYTPDSTDNYWIGGFQIDKFYQDRGYGKQAVGAIIDFIIERHPKCEMISLTVKPENIKARNLYRSMLFTSENEINQDSEIIYRLQVK